MKRNFKNKLAILRSEFALLKKIIIALALLVVIALIGCASRSGTPNQTLTVEDLSKKENYSIGEFNKDYRLAPKNKQSVTANMSINLTSIKFEKEKALSETTLHNVITITNAGSLDETKKIASEALFFELYNEKGRKIAPQIKIYVIGTSDGKSEIIIHSEKMVLSMFKFLAIGPVADANEKELLFEIHP